MRFKIMTFNIQHGVDYTRRTKFKIDLANMTDEEKEILKKNATRKEDPTLIDLGRVSGEILKEDPILCTLNEVRDESDDPCFSDQAKIIGDGCRMPYHYFAKAIDIGGRGPYGNALVSAYPILEAETILVPDPLVKDEPAYYETRALLKAKVALPSGDVLTVMTVHMGLAKQEARNAVQTVLENTPEEGPVILMGDFNLEPGSEILAPLKEKFFDAGTLLPEGTKTYPSDEPEIKIDYIMTRNVKVLEAQVPADIISDHRPHTAVIEL